MPHMIPHYLCDDFYTGEGPDGTVVAPTDLFRGIDDFVLLTNCTRHTVEVVQRKFWSRLTAPGYLDSTDWLGPFDTFEEARTALYETYDVDPETGDDLESEADDA
jgi:hypothetical protein